MVMNAWAATMKCGQAPLTANSQVHPYQLLVTDLDGTLLDEKGHLPPANLQALGRWADQGFQIALATGRNLTITQAIATEITAAINRPIYLIVQDGALLLEFPTRRVLQHHNLDLVAAQQTCEQLQMMGQPAMLFDPLPHGNGFLLCEYGQASTGLARYLQKKPGQYRAWPADQPLESAPSKIVTIDTFIQLEKLHETLRNQVNNARILMTEAVHLDAWFLEIGSPQAAKVQAMDCLLQYLQLDWAAVIAAGDAENDLEMIAAAGLGLAMENGSDRVKRVANLVIGPNHQAGLGQFLETVMAAK